jgi:hypothetical protein
MTAVLAAGALLCGAAPAAAAPRVIVGVLPPDTTATELARVNGMAVGLMSTGIGQVSPDQTYLDISQGNRIDDALYDRPLPHVSRSYLRVPRWSGIVRRAAAAPADIVPGLLGSSLVDAGIRPEPVPAAGAAALMVVDRGGEIGRVVGGAIGVGVFSAGIGTVHRLATTVPAGGLMIAFAEPSSGRQTVPIGIVGSGFHGNLTSDSTRTHGYVLSTDLGPTILARFGLSIPDEMAGEPVRAEGTVDPGAVEDLGRRIAVIPGRRAPLLIVCLSCWIAAAAAVAVLRPQARRIAAAWLALAFAYLPLTLLAGAAVEPTGLAEGLLVGVGAGALAAVTTRFVRGWGALAIACATSVLAYAIDVAAGSELTRLSLLGPNPIFGVRFYGIGNELEALFAVVVPVGVGAGLSAYTRWGSGVSRCGAVATFLLAAVVAGIVFGAGRFGADVGAAIVLPVGAAVAVIALPSDLVHLAPNEGIKSSKSSWRRVLVAVVGAPFIALLFLALIDLVSGGNAHLTRSLLDAGGAGDLADVAERRLRLSAHDFAQAAGNPLFWVVVAGIGVTASRWRRIDTWLRPAPLARAGVIGACAAVASGVLVNDSGASFLVLGALALGASLAFAWSQAPGRVQ